MSPFWRDVVRLTLLGADALLHDGMSCARADEEYELLRAELESGSAACTTCEGRGSYIHADGHRGECGDCWATGSRGVQSMARVQAEKVERLSKENASLREELAEERRLRTLGGPPPVCTPGWESGPSTRPATAPAPTSELGDL